MPKDKDKGEIHMTLDEGEIGQNYVIEEMVLPIKLQKRLEALGMTSGTGVQVLNSKSKGTLIIKVRGTRFAIGKDISKNISVRG